MAISALAGLGKLTELRQRILVVLGAMVGFRFGTHIPVPGVDPVAVVHRTSTASFGSLKVSTVCATAAKGKGGTILLHT